MERSEIFGLMGALKLHGMKAAYDELMAAAIKRRHEPQRIIAELLRWSPSRAGQGIRPLVREERGNGITDPEVVSEAEG